MLLGLSEALPSLVEAKFRSAKAAQSLIFSPTELAVIRTSAGIPFQLRYCPALAKKPVAKKGDAAPAAIRPDPFDNPPADLLIARIPHDDPSHLLVLNKYPVIAGHFILATKANKPQTHALEEDDLEAAYACLQAWQGDDVRGGPRRLFAFFNSGDHSGASQPHRHLQFLPLENMKENGGPASPWDLLIDLILASPEAGSEDLSSRLIQHPDLPFTHFALKLPPATKGAELLAAYQTLYTSAKEAVDKFIATNPGSLTLHPSAEGHLPISYNLAMTTVGMAILPRRSEGGSLQRDGGTELGFIALNGTTLGGTLMVKHQEEWDLLRAQPEKLQSILAAIGIPRDLRTGKLRAQV
ncbi:Ap4A phosphorylase-like protein II [Massariosphaeria phaeospora]|uniref:Ap4A phosphorylase-like protein II n=1 Tax=Massariosphaeria phaeospora TaxID=100035 RepID=A0A7C8MF67_9PLEO|nr:Ap4A phosphorylase-like protein II [Massariosphaeria phaeospora]